MIIRPVIETLSQKTTAQTSHTLLMRCCFFCLASLLVFNNAVAQSEIVLEKFDCQAVIKAGGSDKHATAVYLAADTHSFPHMKCASNTLKSIADMNRGDLDDQITALHAYADYIFYLNEDALFNFSYIVEEWHSIETDSVASLKEAIPAFNELLQRAEEISPDDPRVLYYKAVALGVHMDSIPLLKRALVQDVSGQDGLTYALLGEYYFGLPDLAGGDIDLAIGNLQEALKRDPSNPRTIRLLSSALEENGEDDNAMDILAKMINLTPSPHRLQATADELRNAVDLADRVGQQDLSSKLKQRRDSLLGEHPYLMTRVLTSLLMHSGEEHPLESER